MKKVTLVLLSLMMSIGFVAAQNVKVSGNVISAEDGESVIGASILVKGQTIGTVTDFDGNFTLDVPSSAKTLVVSYIGMKSQEVAVKPNLKIVLESDSEMLDEVIVVAYGTAKKSSFTGSAATIKNEKIVARQTSNITNALAGQVAGVQTTSSNGQPGSDATIRIRGIGSMSASNTPLYVVDGVPYDGEISAINPQDIETMTVLKDAASNALYGARGANGVVMITTKKGKNGEAKVSLDAKWGSNTRGVPSYNSMTDPGMYYETFHKGLYNQKFNGTNAADAYAYANQVLFDDQAGGLGYQVYTLPEGANLIGENGKLNPAATLGYTDGDYYYKPDNWADCLFNSTLRQEYNLSISGATDKMNFYLSAGYLDDKGLAPGSAFTRYSTRLKADYQAKKWLKVGANLSYTHYDSQQPEDQTSASATSSGNLFGVTNNIAPIYPLYVRNPDGAIKKDHNGFTVYDFGDPSSSNFSRPFMGMANPASLLEHDKLQYVADVISSRWFAHFDIFEGLKAQINYGLDVNSRRYTNLYNAYYGQYAGVGGIAYVGNYRNFSMNQQYLLTYNKTINEVHNLDFLAGFESYNYAYETLYGSKEKLFNPEIPEIDNAIINPSVNSSTDNYATKGFLFRAQYDYDGKYHASVSYRRDASSRFHKDNRWGNFWSIGGGWLMNKEAFMEDLEWVNMLKFKASYGVQGNDNLLYSSGGMNYYPYQDQFIVSNNNGDFATTLYYKGNKDITWETSHSFNTGFDFALFKNRLTGTVEYFSRKTTDMLYYMPVSPSLGYSEVPMNVGSMINRGVELDLNYNIVDNSNLLWSVNFNLTHFKNKVLELEESLEGELIDGSRIYREGESMYQLYIRDYAGVNPENGASMWYKDVLDDKGEPTGKREKTESYAESSFYATGDILPTVYGGFGTSLKYKGFDLGVSLAYQLGGRILDYGYSDLMHAGNSSNAGQNWHMDILNAWSPENKGSNIPRINAADMYTNYTSTRWMTSSDYLSLQNITFGYTLPAKITRHIGLDNVRFYGVADNVALLTARKGLDPRQGYISSNHATYSPIRSFSGGISVTF